MWQGCVCVCVCGCGSTMNKRKYARCLLGRFFSLGYGMVCFRHIRRVGTSYNLSDYAF